MKDKIYLNSISEKDLQTLDNTRQLEISNFVEDNVLFRVNEALAKSDIPVLLSIDEYSSNYTGNLEVLRRLTGLKNLSIYVAMGEISSIEPLKNLHNLETLELKSIFKKGISLEILMEFPKLKKFQLDNGFNTKQHSVLNELKKLEALRSYDLDLSKMKIHTNLKSLQVCKKLLNADRLNETFPNLTNLYLEKCKEVDIASAIAPMQKLENIWLRYMPHVTSLPSFKNAGNIRLFQATKLGQLKDISNLFAMENLQALMMTELEFLTADDFIKLTELKQLEVAYVSFKSIKENDKFQEFCQKHNYTCRQPALVNDKFDM